MFLKSSKAFSVSLNPVRLCLQDSVRFQLLIQNNTWTCLQGWVNFWPYACFFHLIIDLYVDMISFSQFYRHLLELYLAKLAQLVPLPYSWLLSTQYMVFLDEMVVYSSMTILYLKGYSLQKELYNLFCLVLTERRLIFSD